MDPATSDQVRGWMQRIGFPVSGASPATAKGLGCIISHAGSRDVLPGKPCGVQEPQGDHGRSSGRICSVQSPSKEDVLAASGQNNDCKPRQTDDDIDCSSIYNPESVPISGTPNGKPKWRTVNLIPNERTILEGSKMVITSIKSSGYECDRVYLAWLRIGNAAAQLALRPAPSSL